jgi:hypothetical protein
MCWCVTDVLLIDFLGMLGQGCAERLGMIDGVRMQDVKLSFFA